MHPPVRLLAMLALVLFELGGPALADAANVEITIARMKFGPVPSLKVGDVITWRNNDIFRHTATARDKSFDIDLPPKSTQKMTVDRAGKIAFYCRFHPMMTGTLDVQP